MQSIEYYYFPIEPTISSSTIPLYGNSNKIIGNLNWNTKTAEIEVNLFDDEFSVSETSISFFYDINVCF